MGWNEVVRERRFLDGLEHERLEKVTTELMC